MRLIFVFPILLCWRMVCFPVHAQSACQDGLIEIGNMCYFFDVDQKMSVFGAKSRCASLKARLPVFPSVLDYIKFNETVLASYPNLKLALGLQLVDNEWTWMTDGSTTENLYWQTGVRAPHDDPARQCVVRTDGGWQNVICDGTNDVTAVCQQGKSVNVSEIPCAPLYRFGYGWEHVITTNMADALHRGFTLNQTDALNGPLYAPTIHIPGITQPLYEVQNPLSAHMSMVNTDEELRRLMKVYNFTIRGIVTYTLASGDFADATMRHMSWSSDPPGDTIVSTDEEHLKYIVNWNWKDKAPVYVFERTIGPGRCRLEKNCTLTEWSLWSNCSASCGNATRFRNRTLLEAPVGVGTCGEIEEVEQCQLELCPSITYFTTLTKEEMSALEDSGILGAISDQQSLVASVTNSVLPALFASHTSTSHDAGHQLNDTIEFCMYDDAPCDEERLFENRLNPFYGNCFTFNPRESELNVTRAGPQGGLRLLMRVEQHEYYPCTQTAGFKVYMHPPNEHPFVETFGYNIAPGLVTSMAISMGRLEKKDTPSNPCTDFWDDPRHPGITYYYNGTYTPEGCTRSCLQDYVIRECNCADPRYARPSNVTFCSDVDDNLVDADRNYGNYTSVKALCPDYHQNTSCRKDYLKEAGCSCISQCIRTYFDAVINTARLLSTEHMEAVACEELNYTEGCSEQATKRFALLEIYYEELQSVVFSEKEAQTVLGLLQDISNMVQNINGFDFFAVFEVGFLIAEIANVIIFSRHRKGRFRNSRIPFIRLLADDTTMTEFLFFLITFFGSLIFLAFFYAARIFDIVW